MKKDVFKFRVQNLSYGWCRVLMLINDKKICFNAEYTGHNPLDSLISACADLMEEGGKYFVKWIYHDVALAIEMNLVDDETLCLDIFKKEKNSFPKKQQESVLEEWHETIPFDAFVSSVKTEGFRVLNAFGLYGYYRSWMDHTAFPLANLLRISGNDKEWRNGDSFCSDIQREIEILQEHIAMLRITEETKIDECVVYYESWQIQCCGDPFSVGERVEWTCHMPLEYKNAHGIIIDFEEDHHGFTTHRITGTVIKILAERSEFPKGQREVWYDRAPMILDELQDADGWESQMKDDETTEHTFWGYIVTLKDVIVAPIS